MDMMMRMTETMGPEFLVSDATYVQQQFQHGTIAMANLWASRAGAMNDEAESQVVGMMHTALGDELGAFFTGDVSAEQALVAVEASYTVAAQEAGLLE